MISEVQKIYSFGAPELQPYATLRRPLEHRQQGIFVAESERVVRRLLASRFTVVSMVMPERHLESFRASLEARPEPIAVYLAEKKLLETLTGYSVFQGVFAVAKIPKLATLEEIYQKSPSPRLFVAVDEMSNAENLGALVRNCAAFGVHGLIVGETSSSPYLRRAVRNSMGTIFELPIFEIETVRNGDPNLRRDDPIRQLTLVKVLHDLRKRGVHCVAAHPHTDKKVLSQADFTKDCCIVLGNE
ncbi:MAG TPA: RNA methyltransferase, partial [Candidatus Baltobacteraceae bacterium]|nr:RNA methyltransferase [Candidatus Baltobacteraceae bacterium]